ncbi:MAG: response regulator [bacterium]|nr:response regulator [bacterium]
MNEIIKPLILTIEDERSFRSSVRNFLEDYDYEVLEAENGPEGVDIFFRERPSLVLLDLRMPGMDGLEVLEKLRAASPETPIIVLSGAGIMDDVVQALRLGAWDYLLKPLEDADMLKHAVEKGLHHALLLKKNCANQKHLESEVSRRTKELQDTTDALKKSEEKYRILNEHLKDVVLSVSTEGKLLDVSAAITDFGGYEPDDQVGNSIGCYFAEATELEKAMALLNKGITEDRASSFEFLFQPKNGKPFPVEVTAKNLTKDNVVVAIHCSMRDISQRKKMERLLRRSEQRFKDISYNMADWIWELDENGKFSFASGKVKQLLDYEPRELLEKTPMDLMPEEEAARVGKIFKALWEHGKPVVDLECLHLTKTDEQVYLQISGVPVYDVKGTFCGYRGVAHDITDRKRAEEEKQRLEQQLFHAQKMEAIGTLSGGIAHDFNNLLTVINGHAEIGLIKLEKMDKNEAVQKIYKDLDSIFQAGKRAANLTRQLLTFSRKQVYEPKVIDINDLVKRLEKMLHRLIGSDISFKIHLDRDIPNIKADPCQIEQVLMNLVVNARDAVNARKGRTFEKQITIETHRVFPDEAFAAEHPESRRGLHTVLVVSDSGIGMTTEIKEKIFEPFFTTKAPGKGTGLGMAAVYGIIKQNKACIYVYSEPDHGSTLKIYWPSTCADAVQEQIIKKDENSLEGNEVILLVEDQDAVRNFARETLTTFGYTVYQASNGRKALELLDTLKVQVDLLLTDLIMPEMNGMELAEQVEEKYPTIEILYASGYTDKHLKHTGALDEGIHFIHKPYSIEDLGKKIREVLENW